MSGAATLVFGLVSPLQLRLLLHMSSFRTSRTNRFACRDLSRFGLLYAGINQVTSVLHAWLEPVGAIAQEQSKHAIKSTGQRNAVGIALFLGSLDGDFIAFAVCGV